MKQLLHISLLFLSFQAQAQFDKLTVHFYPSFMDSSMLSVNRVENEYSMTLETSQISTKSMLNSFEVDSLNSFMTGYNFQIKSSLDTVETIQKIINGDTTVQYVISMGNDGITVKGQMEYKEKSKSFAFWSPNKGVENHELIELLFNLMSVHFTKLETVNYLEQLEQYFDFGLGLKKINYKPLTYKLYGSISANEVSELYDFFDSLNPEIVTHIDMSNFSGMGTMFDEDFLDLSMSHPKIRWINCSKSAKESLRRAGIKRRRFK